MSRDAIVRWADVPGDGTCFWHCICYALNLANFRFQSLRDQTRIGRILRQHSITAEEWAAHISGALANWGIVGAEVQSQSGGQNNALVRAYQDAVNGEVYADDGLISYIAKRYNLLILMYQQFYLTSRSGELVTDSSGNVLFSEGTWYKVEPPQANNETILLLMRNKNNQHFEPMWFADRVPRPNPRPIRDMRARFTNRLPESYDDDPYGSNDSGEEPWACLAQDFLRWAETMHPGSSTARGTPR